jgi:hypothetical protein
MRGDDFQGTLHDEALWDASGRGWLSLTVCVASGLEHGWEVAVSFVAVRGRTVGGVGTR